MRILRVWIHLYAALAITAMVFATPFATAAEPPKLVCDIWPPYQIETPTGVTGMTVEIVESVYHRMGITQFKLRALPWKRAMDAIRFHEADALFSANYTKERAVFLHYPKESLFESSWVIWTKRDKGIHTLDDLKGKTVGVVLGYSYTPEFWNFIETYCKIEKIHADAVNFKKLRLNRLDATVAEYGNGLSLAREVGDPDIVPVPEIEIKRDGLYIAFDRQRVSEEVVQRFSDALKAFKQTDEYQRIRGKYLGFEE